MNDGNTVYLTEEGYQKIKEELEYLKNEKRIEISERLELAIAEGDISENADYDYAKQEQAFCEGRIKDLEDSLRRAEIIKDSGSGNTVRIGNRVTIVEDGDDYEEAYRIVGVHEANPTKGLISNESPIGRALLGAKVGQTVVVDIPTGKTRFKIKAID